MPTLHTIWINIGIYTASFLWTIIGLALFPFLFLGFRTLTSLSTLETTRFLAWLYGRGWVWLTSLFIPVTFEAKAPPTPCILVSNHASIFDTYFVGGLPLWNICWVINDWPYSIPFYRPFMEAAGYIRAGKRNGGNVVEQSLQALEHGENIFFYPEGTRTSTGRLGRFHSGAFLTAVKAQVPIAPICIAGTFELLPSGTKTLRKATVTVRLLPPVYPDKYSQLSNGHIAMRKDVKKLMEQALKEMEKQPSTSV